MKDCPKLRESYFELRRCVAAQVHLRGEASRGESEEALDDGEVHDPRGEQRGRVALPDGAGLGRGSLRIYAHGELFTLFQKSELVRQD